MKSLTDISPDRCDCCKRQREVDESCGVLEPARYYSCQECEDNNALAILDVEALKKKFSNGLVVGKWMYDYTVYLNGEYKTIKSLVEEYGSNTGCNI